MSKATALAIGTPDGFDVSDNADFTIEKTRTLVCKPTGESLKLTDPNIPPSLLRLCNALVDHMAASVVAVRAPAAQQLLLVLWPCDAWQCACVCLTLPQESQAWKPSEAMISRYAGCALPSPPLPSPNPQPQVANPPPPAQRTCLLCPIRPVFHRTPRPGAALKAA